MRKPALNLNFHGARHGVRVFGDGQMVIHTVAPGDEPVQLVVSLQGGTHELRTLSRLHVLALLGPCTVKIRNGKTTRLPTRARMLIPAGSIFTVSADSAVLQVIPDQGPGFAKGRGDDDLLP